MKNDVEFETLQDMIDAFPSGATLELMPRREYAGPVVISKALTVDGYGATIWALNGPVVIVRGAGVTLRNLVIEVTDDEANADATKTCALQVKSDTSVMLENIEVRGTVCGWLNEECDWHYPHTLVLGRLMSGTSHEFSLRLQVPVSCLISSTIAGLDVDPHSLRPGANDLQLRIDRLPKDMLLHGSLYLQTGPVRRRIPVSGYITADSDAHGTAPLQGTGQLLWTPMTAPDSDQVVRVPADEPGWAAPLVDPHTPVISPSPATVVMPPPAVQGAPSSKLQDQKPGALFVCAPLPADVYGGAAKGPASFDLPAVFGSPSTQPLPSPSPVAPINPAPSSDPRPVQPPLGHQPSPLGMAFTTNNAQLTGALPNSPPAPGADQGTSPASLVGSRTTGVPKTDLMHSLWGRGREGKKD